MPPNVDLVVVFRARKTLSKQEAIDEAKQAEEQYAQLINVLTTAGLRATGRRGDGDEILILVSAPWAKIVELIQRDRHVDFLHGLPASSLPIVTDDLQPSKISPAARIRLLHTHLTSSFIEGGLAIVPKTQAWSRVQSITPLHDDHFNEAWLHSWTREQTGFGLSFPALEKIKDQFGEEVALYFSFLSFYAKSLWFPSGLGLLFFVLGKSYNIVYSLLLCLWAVTFVEWWSIRERVLAIRWGCQGAALVERRRPEFIASVRADDPDDEDFPWWKREVRTLASIPVILAFAAMLATLLTAIFVFEAFITVLYTGPLHEYASFLPTVLFVALVPQVLAMHQKVAERLTNWENHKHRSSHEAALTIKVFALSGVVAYLGLALSAFVYVPFGEQVMTYVHAYVASPSATNESKATPTFAQAQFGRGLSDAHGRLDAGRLQKQMFAYMVTNQIIGVFLEVALPMVLRGVQAARSAGLRRALKSTHVRADDDESEKAFLEDVRRQVSLPDYTVFADYAEMVTQFGYVVLWSTIWPLAPVMAFLNNWLELRGDAFKISKNFRRPIPARRDTVGPWLEALAFIAWLAALTNAALVYMFHPAAPHPADVHIGTAPTQHTAHVSQSSAWDLATPVLLIALSSSHGFFAARVLVRHVLQRLFWERAPEQRLAEKRGREVKEVYLRSVQQEVQTPGAFARDDAEPSQFWERDDAKGELQRRLKEA
ncbi:DUF590-domain-containing protein [Exidia glandulosa HHB12029]|uniref:DUF590-domain-containing protein n=1 Tax=Exidia glandulosa HHB12029 TaxID=1314781 RepID=A0A165M423_EXIGL|nr:DUF590-domain-containing protein [Exidia glandulosa HHB12029]